MKLELEDLVLLAAEAIRNALAIETSGEEVNDVYEEDKEAALWRMGPFPKENGIWRYFARARSRRG